MNAPVSLALGKPTELVSNWPQQEVEWAKANHDIGEYFREQTLIGNPCFSALTIKAGYVMGVIHDICTTVEYLINFGPVITTYLPAYGVFSAAVDILGRCVKGECRHDKDGLKAGFFWLKAVELRVDCRWVRSWDKIRGDEVLIETGKGTRKYSTNDLETCRHFAVHGQATSKEAGNYTFQDVDYEVLERLLPKLRDGLEVYWNELQCDENLCNRLACANVLPLRPWPIAKIWKLFQGRDGQGDSITNIWNQFNWTVK